jgi:hypothetical protein
MPNTKSIWVPSPSMTQLLGVISVTPCVLGIVRIPKEEMRDT